MTVTLGTTDTTNILAAPALPEGQPGFLQRSNLMRTIMKLWYLKIMGDRMNVPTPRDLPEYRSNRPAWRVLLVGNGPTHGWGVATHGLALTGQIANALNRKSGQAVDVDYVGDELMNAATTVSWLGDTQIAAYDEIIVVLSMNDAVRLTPEESWSDEVEEILAHLRIHRRPETKMVVVGIQPVTSVPEYKNVLGKIGQGHADRLNAIMNASVVAAGDTFMYLPEPVTDVTRPQGSPATYHQWADDIAAYAAPLLPAGEPRENAYEPMEWAWAPSVEALGFDGIDRSEPFRQIVAEAKKDLRVPIGYVSVMDKTRQFFITGEGPLASSVPRELSYCDYTARQDEPLVVPNGNKDERFKDNPYIEITHMPFYAGQSLKSREGEVIGTFCVMAPFPKAERSLKMEKFQAYAKRAQDELWKIEDEVSARQAVAEGHLTDEA